jgi:hypothetical protein
MPCTGRTDVVLPARQEMIHRQEWRAFVRKLLKAVAGSVFERAQGLSEAEFLFVPDA